MNETYGVKKTNKIIVYEKEDIRNYKCLRRMIYQVNKVWRRRVSSSSNFDAKSKRLLDIICSDE